MDSMQEEMDDSRTSAVGRKRNHEELLEASTWDHSSPSEGEQRTKRIREDEPSEDSIFEDGIVFNMSSPSLVSSKAPSDESSQILSTPTLASAIVPAPVGAWNKGVQTGLRTSFGSRAKKPQPKPVFPSSQSNSDALKNTTTLCQEYTSASLNPGERMETKVAESADSPELQIFLRNINEAGHVMKGASDTPEIRSAATSEEEGEISSGPFGQPAGDEVSFLKGIADEANFKPHRVPRFLDRDRGQASGIVFDVDVDPREAAKRLSSSSSDGYNMEDAFDDSAGETGTNSVLQAGIQPPSSLDHASQLSRPTNGEQSKHSNTLTEIESFSLLTAEAEAMFAHDVLPLTSNYDAVKANIAAGRTFFPRTARHNKPFYNKKGIDYSITEILDKGRPTRIQDLTLDMFALVFLKENSGKKITENILASAFNAYQTRFYSNPAITIFRSNGAEKDEVKEASRQKAKNLLAKFPPGTDAKTLPDAATEPILNATAKIDIDQVDIDQMERALQAKYFPATNDRPVTYHCLACGLNNHMTLDCPSLTYALCGGDHAGFACKQNRRCNKCRQRGHDIAQCPEKLALSKAEAVGCDYCGSTDHFEAHCHTIWRTFHPQPEEIRKVREISVHCYICGGAGHFGPECGLYRDCPLLTGGRTWSKENLSKFIDNSSSARAVSAGIDYSIGSKTKKQLNFKGKANNPIDLDESDDGDVAFIHEKIKGPKNHAQIKIAGASELGQLPQKPHFPRAPNPPRASRPVFSGDFGRNAPPGMDSARYGRERTFSPPPRFDDMRDGFHESEVRYQRENAYRPQPLQPRYDYEPAPQASLPVRPSGNSSRGGRGRHGNGVQKSGRKNTSGGGAAGGGGKKKKRGGSGAVAGKGGAARRGK